MSSEGQINMVVLFTHELMDVAHALRECKRVSEDKSATNEKRGEVVSDVLTAAYLALHHLVEDPEGSYHVLLAPERFANNLKPAKGAPVVSVGVGEGK